MRYEVTMRFQFPAWDERDGVVFEVVASSKREACAEARRQAYHDGYLCGGQGRVTFKATEVE